MTLLAGHSTARKLPAALLLSLSVWLVGSREVAAVETTFDLSAGHRTGSLNWNIASDPGGTLTPNILSELTWRKLQIRQVSGGLHLTGAYGLHFRATADYGWIYAGKSQDSDYLGNNRTLEFSRTIHDTPGDNAWDLAFALGYRLRVAQDRSASYLIPLVGYSRSAQNLRITNGKQTIPATGSIAGLDSAFQSRWASGWLGVEFVTDRPSNVSAYFRLAHHWADHSAEANWNLRQDLMHPRSFTNDANGTGIVLSAGLGTILPGSNRLAAHIGLDYQRWTTEPGVHRVYFADGTVGTTRLNGVEWKSWALSLGLRWSM